VNHGGLATTGRSTGDKRYGHLLQQIINGLVLGSMYALIALGYHGVRHHPADQLRPRRGADGGGADSWSVIGLMQEAMPGCPAG
jgi:branched-chain amino acid transport system permease protein